MGSSSNPLSPKSIFAGVIVTVIGGVILALVIQDARFDPTRRRKILTPKPEAQIVEWIPLYITGVPGMCINGCAEFIPWSELREEFRQKVLPQVANIPAGSTLLLKDSQGKQNWIIQVFDPSENEVANVWIGNDPEANWKYDGRVRVGSPYAPLVVWATFQRYSDGSYWKQ
jgi:hypothetical protein